MPTELKERVTIAAASNNRSLHAELISRLQQSFEAAVAKTDVQGQVLADLRANEMSMDTLRGHLDTVKMHEDILQQRLDAMEKSGAEENGYDVIVQRLVTTQSRVRELEQQMGALQKKITHLKAMCFPERKAELKARSK